MAADAKTVRLARIGPRHKGKMNLRCQMWHFAQQHRAGRVDRFLAERAWGQRKNCQERHRKMPAIHASHSTSMPPSRGTLRRASDAAQNGLPGDLFRKELCEQVVVVELELLEVRLGVTL